ncbi:hypothetical protein JW949_02405 [Candidatus Woesearchaeota archaeon]|nr:hypothetical protein [Candidatus Woesearchaeota archaeon]
MHLRKIQKSKKGVQLSLEFLMGDIISIFIAILIILLISKCTASQDQTQESFFELVEELNDFKEDSSFAAGTGIKEDIYLEKGYMIVFFNKEQDEVVYDVELSNGKLAPATPFNLHIRKPSTLKDQSGLCLYSGISTKPSTVKNGANYIEYPDSCSDLKTVENCIKYKKVICRAVDDVSFYNLYSDDKNIKTIPTEDYSGGHYFIKYGQGFVMEKFTTLLTGLAGNMQTLTIEKNKEDNSALGVCMFPVEATEGKETEGKEASCFNQDQNKEIEAIVEFNKFKTFFEGIDDWKVPGENIEECVIPSPYLDKILFDNKYKIVFENEEKTIKNEEDKEEKINVLNIKLKKGEDMILKEFEIDNLKLYLNELQFKIENDKCVLDSKKQQEIGDDFSVSLSNIQKFRYLDNRFLFFKEEDKLSIIEHSKETVGNWPLNGCSGYTYSNLARDLDANKGVTNLVIRKENIKEELFTFCQESS